jgi:hypothetical protein
MASYQIPQFLDSGDKILGPLNIRQFAYALGGFFICVLIFTLTQSAAPEIGFYAILPALPVAGLTAYIALGKYNGRDSEIYILKFILFNLKPRVMMYRRVPEITDLNEQEAMLTYDKIIQEWNGRVNKLKSMEDNELKGFSSMNASERARKIREIGTQMDMGFYNTIRSVQQGQLKLAEKQAVLQKITASKGRRAPLPLGSQNSGLLPGGSAPNPVLSTPAPTTTTKKGDYDDIDEVNFFDLEDSSRG